MLRGAVIVKEKLGMISQFSGSIALGITFKSICNVGMDPGDGTANNWFRGLVEISLALGF